MVNKGVMEMFVELHLCFVSLRKMQVVSYRLYLELTGAFICHAQCPTPERCYRD